MKLKKKIKNFIKTMEFFENLFDQDDLNQFQSLKQQLNNQSFRKNIK